MKNNILIIFASFLTSIYSQNICYQFIENNGSKIEVNRTYFFATNSSEFTISNKIISDQWLHIPKRSPDGGNYLRTFAKATGYSEGGDSSGKNIYKLKTNSVEGLNRITFPLKTNLEAGKTYTLFFYQATASKKVTGDNLNHFYAQWIVGLPGSSSLPPELHPNQGNGWQKVEINFKPTGNAINSITFYARSSTGDSSGDRRHQELLLDGVYVFEKDKCEITPCDSYSSFSPTVNKKYVLSAWAKEEVSGVVNYTSPKIDLKLNGATVITAEPSGQIIDGWQQIQTVFTISEDASNLGVKLRNTGTNNVYFDDIRIHPFDGNMKSFVYDPVSQRLMAELDENNYATFYEYDNEGGLIRVKKETERGVQTIQETRSATKLRENNRL